METLGRRFTQIYFKAGEEKPVTEIAPLTP